MKKLNQIKLPSVQGVSLSEARLELSKAFNSLIQVSSDQLAEVAFPKNIKRHSATKYEEDKYHHHSPRDSRRDSEKPIKGSHSPQDRGINGSN